MNYPEQIDLGGRTFDVLAEYAPADFSYLNKRVTERMRAQGAEGALQLAGQDGVEYALIVGPDGCLDPERLVEIEGSK